MIGRILKSVCHMRGTGHELTPTSKAAAEFAIDKLELGGLESDIANAHVCIQGVDP